MVVQVSRATTEGYRNLGGASRSLGGRDDNRSQSSGSRRWIPPSSLRRDALSQDNEHDVTFRKIRGLLNKLTPETFDKLTNDLLNVGLNARVILGGLIVLIFKKALDEPKYCSMYAQLCKKLSEEAPNFEPQGSPCTFNIQLLKQCQEEFERRRKSKELYENGAVLSNEEEEQRLLARRKMVGNLRFIGELGKLQIISKTVLYQCIEQLLEKSRRSSGDVAEDLECLCQIMRTSGRILDTEEAQPLMNQYFNRIHQLSVSSKLQLRIRFMLQDIIDLRSAAWRPRKIALTDGPRTITEVREEAARDLGVYIPPPTSNAPPVSQYSIINPLANAPTFFSKGGGRPSGMEDVFGLSLDGCASLGTGPGVISTQPEDFTPSQTFTRTRPMAQNYQPTNNYYQNKHFSNNYNRQQNNNNGYQQHQNNQAGYNKDGGKELPPRFKKMFSGGNDKGGRVEDSVSLRPAAMSLKPKTPGLLPQSAISQHNPHDKGSQYSGGQKQSMNISTLHKDPPLIINKLSDNKSNRPKKEKAMSRGEYMKRVRALMAELTTKRKDDQQETNGLPPVNKVEIAFASLKALKLPERLLSDAAHVMLSASLTAEDTDAVVQLLTRLNTAGLLGHDKLWDGLKQALSERDVCGGSKDKMADILSLLVVGELVKLSELGELMNAGQHYPLFLVLLQKLQANMGKTSLTNLFAKSKLNLLNLVPEAERTKERLSDVLEERGLSFLVPLLRIQSDLKAGLEKDPSPHAFFKFIKDTLDAKHHTEPAFVSALVSVLLASITGRSTLAEGSDHSVNPDKATAEREKELLCKYKPVLQAFLHDHINLQIISIYALQVFTYSNKFPKGMLLRWFVYLYDLEIVEEEAFLAWKEDVNDDYPGKGKALFQVNQWLTWLQTTEEDDDDEDEDAE